MEPDPDLDSPATKRDLLQLQTELKTELEAELEALRLEVAKEIARSADVFYERTQDLFRVATDLAKAVHRVPRTRAR